MTVLVRQTVHVNGGEVVRTVIRDSLLTAVVDLMSTDLAGVRPHDLNGAATAVAGELAAGAEVAAHGTAVHPSTRPAQPGDAADAYERGWVAILGRDGEVVAVANPGIAALLTR